MSTSTHSARRSLRRRLRRFLLEDHRTRLGLSEVSTLDLRPSLDVGTGPRSPRISSVGPLPPWLELFGWLRPTGKDAGHSLAEAVIVVALIALAAIVTAPALSEAQRTATLRSLGQEMSSLMMRCRAQAILHRQTTALVFELHTDGWHCYVAEDGDGDGVRRDDLEAGHDRLVSEMLQLAAGGSSLGILTDQRVPDPMGNGWLVGDDPVRAGLGNIISFTPDGTATPSSVYLTDHRSQMRVLRVIGGTGRIRALVWKSGWPRWKRTWW